MGDERVMAVLREVLAPLIEADGGELYLSELGKRTLHLHLAGRFAGCPGNTLVERRIIEPAVHAVAPDLTVRVTSGCLIPPGSQRLSRPKGAD